MAEHEEKKRCRSSLEEADSTQVKKLRLELLESLEDDEVCSTAADLDSFMKSFQEQISPPPVKEAELPDFGYLLEASDDELGLPPSKLGAELVQASSELSELWGFDEQITGFDSFEFGAGNEYLGFEGLFDYSDMGFGSADFVC